MRTFLVTILHAPAATETSNLHRTAVRNELIKMLPEKSWDNLRTFHGNSTSSFNIDFNEDYALDHLAPLIDAFEFMVRSRISDGKDECIKSLTCVGFR
ncbi:MAG TPA: hypothetical protein VJJ47_03470 [Candidatus Paceibacterota bacterium]